MSSEKFHYMFIHNVFGDFVKGISEYFSDHLYPRFNWVVIGTYDKAIERLTKKDQLDGREPDQPNLPALIINPTGDFNLDDPITGGKQLYRFPNLAPGFLPRLYDPIYRDENVSIVPGFTRLKGELEFISLLNSFYEYCDLRILLLQIFGGIERIIYPIIFNSFIILDNEIRSYKYENDVTNVEYNIDWLNNGATQNLVRTTNKNEVVFPCRIRPFLSLTNQGDNSERYGGTENLADYRLTFTVRYEVEIPTSIVIFENLDLVDSERHLELNISYGSSTSDYISRDAFYASQLKEKEENLKSKVIFPSLYNPLIIQEREDISKLAGFEYDETGDIIKDVMYPPVNETTYKSNISEDDNVTNVDKYAIELLARYYHNLTQSDIDSTTYIDVSLPTLIENPDSYVSAKGFKVNSKYGELDYKDHYDIISVNQTGDTLRIFMEFIKGLNSNDIIEIFYYKVTAV